MFEFSAEIRTLTMFAVNNIHESKFGGRKKASYLQEGIVNVISDADVCWGFESIEIYFNVVVPAFADREENCN